MAPHEPLDCLDPRAPGPRSLLLQIAAVCALLALVLPPYPRRAARLAPRPRPGPPRRGGGRPRPRDRAAYPGLRRRGLRGAAPLRHGRHGVRRARRARGRVRRHHPRSAAAPWPRPSTGSRLRLASSSSSVVRVACSRAAHYGHVTGVPWAMRYPRGTAAFLAHLETGLVPASAEHALPVHPAQAYEAALGLVMAGVGLLIERKKPRAGAVFAAVVATYAAGRLVTDLFRGDSRPMLGPLDAAMVVDHGPPLAWSCGPRARRMARAEQGSGLAGALRQDRTFPWPFALSRRPSPMRLGQARAGRSHGAARRLPSVATETRWEVSWLIGLFLLSSSER